MKAFNIKEGTEIGIIKSAIREAILDGVIVNDFEIAYQFMLLEGKKLSLIPVQD